MRNYQLLEDLIKDALDGYKEGFEEHNTEYTVDFQTTLTTHKIDLQGLSAWVAYLRLEKILKPVGATDEEGEHLLIYNQAYKFKNIAERTDPNAPWKYDLYADLLRRLVHGGIEYAELLRRMQDIQKGKTGKPISEIITPQEEKIIITDQMPAPLTEEERKYAEWVKQQKS